MEYLGMVIKYKTISGWYPTSFKRMDETARGILPYLRLVNSQKLHPEKWCEGCEANRKERVSPQVGDLINTKNDESVSTTMFIPYYPNKSPIIFFHIHPHKSL